MLNALSLSLNHCVLKIDQIDIWRYPLHADNPDAFFHLNIDEQNRAKRFHFARHQRRFTNAHSGLRLILARYINENPQQLQFTEGKQGKPSLINDPSLQFNLSHSEDMALLVVGKHHPVGIDLEYFSPRTYHGIGAHLFSPKEMLALKTAPTYLNPLVFFNIWAQKEAFIKACGLGLSYPTQQFDVPILCSDATNIADSVHQCTWQMRSFMPEINCCAAVCYDPHIKTIRYASLTQKQLVDLAHDSIK